MAEEKLKCIICPNEPGFSDLSHLLTHLASKGHLSYEFKAKMRAEQDPTFRAQFNAFEQWKRDRNLNKLLNDRILQKEKKKGGSRQQQRSQTPAGQRTALSNSHRTFSQQLPPGAYAPTAIDPMLTDEHPADNTGLRRSGRKAVKREFSNMRTIDDYDSDELGENCEDAPAPYPAADSLSRGPAVHRSVTRTQGYLPSKAPSRRNSASPMLPPTHASNHRQGSDTSMLEEMASRSSNSNWTQEPGEEAPNEYSILKGTIWPGMDLFDSASPHAKRIRNQKKDSSTLVAMQMYSETIEPLETIRFNPSWEVKKTREITGHVDSSEEETTDPAAKPQYRAKAKRPKLRQPLAPQDKNRQMNKTFAGHKNAVKVQTEETYLPLSGIHQHGGSMPNLNGGLPASWQSQDEMDLYNLTFGDNFHQPRRPKLGVFRDSLPAAERSQSHQMYSEDGDLFVASTPTPRPQLPPFRSLAAVQTPTPHRTNSMPQHGPEAVSAQGRQDSGMSAMFDRDNMQYSGFGNMGNAFGTRNDGFSFQDQYPQRYFNASAGSQTQFSNAVPQYMDFAMAHQQGRLVPTPGAFGSDMYNSFGMTSPNGRSLDVDQRSMSLDNPLSALQGSSLLSLEQSPTGETSSPASKNPLFDFTKSVDSNEQEAETDDDETVDDYVGESA